MNEKYTSDYLLSSDGGPRFIPNSVLNQTFFYQLFKNGKFDLLSVFSYATKYRASTKQTQSALSNKLFNVILSSKFEGKSKSLVMKSNVSNKEGHMHCTKNRVFY